MIFENTLGRYIGRLNYLMSQELNQVLEEAQTGITSDQFRLLTHLWKEDGIAQQTLANLVGRNRGTTARMLDTLEKKNIIVRITEKTDARINLVYLTKTGKSLEKEATLCAQSVLDKLVEGFSEEEKTLFKSLLEKSLSNLKKG